MYYEKSGERHVVRCSYLVEFTCNVAEGVELKVIGGKGKEKRLNIRIYRVVEVS